LSQATQIYIHRTQHAYQAEYHGGTDMTASQPAQKNATYHEIVSQPGAWRAALEVLRDRAPDLRALWSRSAPQRVVFTGCGSTYYLSLAAAATFQTLTGVPARGVPAGELVLYPAATYVPGQTLLVAVSRSGETTETVEAVHRFQREGRGEVVVVTNYPDSTLARLGAVPVAIVAGQERSIAQTRSFASMYVATTALAALLVGRAGLLGAMDGLADAGERLLAGHEDLARTTGADLALDRSYFLGSGPRYGLACEANLKMKEMTLTHSEPFHFLEFRHGPKAMIGPTSLVVGLLSDEARAHEAAVLDEMRGLGAHTLSLGEADTDVAFASGLPAPIRNVLYLPVLQLMAYHRARAKGLDPDRPTHLDAVVRLEWGT
jgi:glucosamine--fructose-6-phosphate aminotransferase (isomerizing)